MGGRGSSGAGGKLTMIEVDYKDGNTAQYRVSPQGEIWSSATRDFIATKRTLNEIANVAEENGYTVTRYTKKQMNAVDKKRAEESWNRPDYELGIGVPWGGREAAKRARANRKITRAFKRGAR